MTNYTVEQRIKIVEFFYASNKSISITQRRYIDHFNATTTPCGNMIRGLIRRFEQFGTVANKIRGNIKRIIRNDENIEAVNNSVTNNPLQSIRRRCSSLGITKSSMQRILKSDLKLFPYKIQSTQALLPRDPEQRLQYSTRFLDMNRSDENFIKNLIMSDEAHFHLNGYVNKQNCRVWATENPRIVQQHQLHPIRCTVWCGIMANRIIGPYFFEDENENPLTVTGESYRNMINNYLRPKVADNPEVWFQQDGATAHTSGATISLLHEIFGNRLISRNSEFIWPPRSPDLSAADFFLWGYLKDRVYVNQPKTIQELKQNIVTEICNIKPETLHSVMYNALERAGICQQENGGHLQDIIFHT